MNILRRFRLFALLACSGLALAACGGGSSGSSTPVTPTLSSISVAASPTSLTPPETSTLTVTGTYSDGSTKNVTSTSTFASSASGVATVSSAGIVTAVAAGSATITATNSSATATVAITVSAPVPTLSSVAVTPATVNLLFGATQQLTLTGTYSDSSTQDLTANATFSVVTNAGVTVSAGGLVTAGSVAGSAIVTATDTVSGKSANAAVTVSAPPPPVLMSMEVAPANPTVAVGATQQLTVTGHYSDSSSKDLTTTVGYLSSDATVASVSAGGLVTAAHSGITTVTASLGAVSAQSTINVPVPAATYAIANFNESGVTYSFAAFGGASGTTTSTGVPAGGPAGPLVASVTKPQVGAQCYAGATIAIGYKNSIPQVPFSATATTVTAVVYAPVAGVDFKLKFEDANDPTHTVETDVVVPTTGWQTLTFDMSKQAPGTAALNPAYTFNKMSVFPDFTCGNSGAAPAADETFFVGPITFIGASAPSAPALSAPPPPAAPTALAATPSHPSANVLSLYNSSGVYTDQTGTNFNPFGDSLSVSQVSIGAGSQKVWEYASMNYQGWQFATIDITSYTTMHVDVWTPDTTQFGVILVNGPISQSQGQVIFNATTTPAITKGAWVSLDIPLSSFTGSGLQGTTSIYQLLFIDNVGGNQNGTFYIDNVYFWK